MKINYCDNLIDILSVERRIYIPRNFVLGYPNTVFVDFIVVLNSYRIVEYQPPKSRF